MNTTILTLTAVAAATLVSCSGTGDKLESFVATNFRESLGYSNFIEIDGQEFRTLHLRANEEPTKDGQQWVHRALVIAPTPPRLYSPETGTVSGVNRWTVEEKSLILYDVSGKHIRTAPFPAGTVIFIPDYDKKPEYLAQEWTPDSPSTKRRVQAELKTLVREHIASEQP